MGLKLRKLDNKGVAHHIFIPILAISLIAGAGAYVVSRSKAETTVRNGQIIFNEEISPGNSTTQRINPDATGKYLLSKDDASDYSWSKDGTQYVYIDRASIKINDYSGTKPNKLRYNEQDGKVTCNGKAWESDYSNPEISPSNTKILFVKNHVKATSTGTCENTQSLMVMNLDGTGLTQITIDGKHDFKKLQWSADSAKIYFYSSTDYKDEYGGTKYRSAIYSIPSTGGATTEITNSALSAAEPNKIAFSYDSKRIAYVSTTEVGAVDLNGTNHQILTSIEQFSSTGNIAWAPDGTAVAFQGKPVVNGVSEPEAIYTATVSPNPTLKKISTGKYSVSIAWQPLTNQTQEANWYVRGATTLKYGALTDIPVPADYNGDKKADKTVWRPSNGTWYRYGATAVQFGKAGDVPLPADYNGDGKADIAVYRPSDSKLYVKGIGTYPLIQYVHGQRLFALDTDGDKKAEIISSLAMFDSINWQVMKLSGSSTVTYTVSNLSYGKIGDIPLPADYNGDGKAELSVYRPSNHTHYVRGGATTVYGTTNDVPLVADFTGDKKADLSVYRASNKTWYARGLAAVQYGQPYDVFTPADYNGDGKAEYSVYRP